ncbi:MFS general substrate transporter [Chlorella sorokiniana]|uniref:MFS general substrate transporter n=1 Tax=Chlorella sorokiniana TaxID=3076 RepID=A0A2P6TKH0_CHLSO|nr:MFS general substrate transporter [Chlorella sorokiniana]|eukprot:PRW44580.1 MFS general substrate transporter [Chlorella sorokiniana]
MDGSVMQSRGSIEKRGLAAGGDSGGSAAAELEAPVDAAAVQRKLDRHLIPWLFALGVLCYLDRTNLSFAALELNRDLNLSCATYGLGASLFFVSYAAFQMPSTMVCAQLGAPTWLAINIIAWGLVAASFALASSVPVFLTLRFLLGATEAAAFPGMYQHLSLFYNEKKLGPAYAKVASCTALAQVVGAPIAAGILAMDGVGGLKGWQWLFLLEGAATVVFGVVLRLCLAPSPAKARMLSHEEREWLQQEQDAARAATAAVSGTRQRRGTLSIIRDWRVLYLSACWLLIAAVMFGLTFFIPIIVGALFSGGAVSGAAGAGHHGACSASSSSGGGGGGSADPASSPQQQQASSVLVALAAAIPFLAAAAGMNVNARLAERANERHRHAGVPILLAAATMAALPLALRLTGPGLAFTLLSLACGFCWSFHGPFFSWPAVFLPGEQASIGFSFINSMGAVGGFIGPWMLGLLTSRQDGGLAPAFLALAAFLAAAGTCLLLFPAPGHLTAAPPEHKNGELDGLADREDDDKDGLECGDAAAEQWQARQQYRQQQQQHEVECQPILPGGSRS